MQRWYDPVIGRAAGRLPLFHNPVMSLRTLVARAARFVAGPGDPPEVLEPRHERRELARECHRVDDEPPWPPEKHHDNPGPYEVQDISPGLPGAPASHRVVGGD